MTSTYLSIIVLNCCRLNISGVRPHTLEFIPARADFGLIFIANSSASNWARPNRFIQNNLKTKEGCVVVLLLLRSGETTNNTHTHTHTH